MRSILKLALICCLSCFALYSFGQQSTTIDLTGVQFRNATNQSRSSATPISPAFAYEYHITGNARGVGGLLGILYPNPTPLATILESLAPGSSAFLDGQGVNPQGTHPIVVADQRIDGQTVILGTTVTYGFDIRIDISAAGIVSFSLTNVVLLPQPTLGYIQMTSGQALILRVPGVIGGSMDLQDFIGDAAQEDVVVELLTPGTGTVVETHVVQPNEFGKWFVQTSQRGTFDVTAKGSHWLRKRLSAVAIADAGQMNLDFSLVNGDVDGDNEVGIGDYAILSTQFGTEGPEADLNGDGEVDIADYAILSANFGALGDD